MKSKMKRDFEKFLKRHRVYQRYFRNMKAQSDDPEYLYRQLLKTPSKLITGAFDDTKTPGVTEKYPHFWTEIDQLLQKELKRLKKK